MDIVTAGWAVLSPYRQCLRSAKFGVDPLVSYGMQKGAAHTEVFFVSKNLHSRVLTLGLDASDDYVRSRLF